MRNSRLSTQSTWSSCFTIILPAAITALASHCQHHVYAGSGQNYMFWYMSRDCPHASFAHFSQHALRLTSAAHNASEPNALTAHPGGAASIAQHSTVWHSTAHAPLEVELVFSRVRPKWQGDLRWTTRGSYTLMCIL